MATVNWNAEVTVNTATAGDQDSPSIATLNDGSFVVVWESKAGGDYDVEMQRFDTGGNPLGGEVTVAGGAGDQTGPQVFALGAGGFSVIWQDGAATVRRQRYAADGSQDGTGGVVSTGGARPVGVGLGGVGKAQVIAFEQNNQISQVVYDANGEAVSAGQVNVTAYGAYPSIVYDPGVSGGPNAYTIAWRSPGDSLRARVFNAGAGASDFVIGQADTYTPDEGGQNQMAGLPGGGIASVEMRSIVVGSIGAQRASIDIVAPLGASTLSSHALDLGLSSYASSVDVVALANQSVMAIWVDRDTMTIHGQQLDDTGTVLAPQFTVGSVPLSTVKDPLGSALLKDGRVAVVWDSITPGGGDNDGRSIQLQIVDPRDGQVVGSAGPDTLLGGDGTDTISGLGGSDYIAGGAGDDLLAGGPGGDTLLGQFGDDVLVGGTGQDYLAGGLGSDVFRFTSSADSPVATPDTVADFTHGVDALDLRGAADGLVALIHGGDGSTGVYFAPSSTGALQGAVYVVGDVEGPDIYADAGTNLYIVGSALAETLIGSAGGDFIQGGGGADYLAGGAGADVFKYTGFADSPAATPDVIGDFQHGMDKIDFTGGGAGTAVNLVHQTGVTYVYFAPGGTAAKGLIVAYGDVEAADVKVDSGVTVVTSGLGGGDVLTTSDNTDLLVGGTGKDTFAVEKVSDSTPSAPDVIEDFQSGTDKIDLSAVSGGAVSIIRDGAWSYVIYAPDGDTADGLIVVHGAVAPADLGVPAGAQVAVSHASIDAALHPEPTADHTRVFLY